MQTHKQKTRSRLGSATASPCLRVWALAGATMDLDWGLAIAMAAAPGGNPPPRAGTRPDSRRGRGRPKGSCNEASKPRVKTQLKPKNNRGTIKRKPGSKPRRKTAHIVKLSSMKTLLYDNPSPYAPTNVTPPPLPPTLIYGSACSGLGTDEWAAAKAHPGRAFEFAFTCDNDPVCIDWLVANSCARHHFHGVELNSFMAAPPTTIFIAGFPCTDFAARGAGAGIDGPQGTIFYYLYKYITANQPRICIMENVEGLVTHHSEVFRMMIDMLTSIIDNVSGDPCYSVHWQLLDSHVVGVVPQKRTRVYMVLFKRCGRAHVPFEWPTPLDPPSVSAVYDLPITPLASYANYPIPAGKHGGLVPSRNVQLALEAIQREADSRQVPPESIPVIVDTGSGKLNMALDRAPCLTKQRGKSLSFFKLQTGEFMSVFELMRLQGFTDDEMARMNFVVSPSQVGKMVGNSFTKTVMQRLIRNAIVAAELCA